MTTDLSPRHVGDPARAAPLSHAASLWIDLFTVAFAYFFASTLYNLCNISLIFYVTDHTYAGLREREILSGLVGMATELVRAAIVIALFAWAKCHWRGRREMFVSFSGRLSRRRYLTHWFLPHLVLSVIIAVVAVAVLVVFGGSDEAMARLVPAAPSLFFMGLVLFWPTLTIHARRLHDLGLSAWFLMGLAVPVLSLILVIAFLFVRGKPGANRFGVAAP